MSFTVFKNNFTGGEWSPPLDGRSDLENYGRACRRLENLRPMPQGGVRLRGGLEFVGECRTGAKPVRLVAFNFSTNTRYVLEFGDKYVRVRRGTDGSIAVSALATPWGASEVFALQFKQINDVMYVVHGEHAPRKLSRLSDTNWTVVEVRWDYPALLNENVDDGVKLSVSATSGGIVDLKAQGAAVFTSGHVGGYFELRHFRQGSEVELGLTATFAPGWYTSNTLAVRGDWEFLTTEYWWGTIFLERSRDNGASWEVMRQWRGQSDRNISTGGRVDEEDSEQLMRIRYSSSGDPYHPPAMNSVNGSFPDGWKHAIARLEVKPIYAKGLVRVTEYVSPTHVRCEVIKGREPVSTGWTDRWSEGAWSVHRGFPRAIGLFEQRLIFGGTREQPIRFWGSRSGDFENFQTGDKDSASFAFDIASSESNPILWIESTQRLCIGTSGGEYTAVGGGSGVASITPSNVAVVFSSAYGSVATQPARSGEDVLFLERQGKTLRELGYDLQRDGFSARNLSIAAEHLFEERGGVELTFVRAPHPQLWAVCGGAHLPVLTHDGELGVGAWARYTSGLEAQFESVCGIYGEPEDQVWVVVRRKVGNTWKRFVERLTPEADESAKARYLDCHRAGTLAYDWNGGVVVGNHLNGEAVRLVVGGVFVGDYTVIGGGIHVPNEVRDNFRALWAKVEADKGGGASLPSRAFCVGVPYRGVLETMRLEVQGEEGSSAGKLRRITKVIPRFHRTGGRVHFGAGEEPETLELINFRHSTDTLDHGVPLFTGDVPLAFQGGHDREGRVVIATEGGLPFTLLGVSVVVGIAG